MSFPSHLKYTKDHEWLLAEGAEVRVGITDFAQGELGDIVFLDINTVGETLEKDTVFGTVEAVKTVSDLFMPVSGKVLEVNPKIISNPELVNKDPYGEGWLIKISVSNPAETEKLLNADDYRKMTGK